MCKRTKPKKKKKKKLSVQSYGMSGKGKDLKRLMKGRTKVTLKHRNWIQSHFIRKDQVQPPEKIERKNLETDERPFNESASQ